MGTELRNPGGIGLIGLLAKALTALLQVTSANERYATMHGVKQVVLPTPGVKSAKRIAPEQQLWLQQGHNWRAGIEGRISGLTRPSREWAHGWPDAM
jgi:hypothetical protein